MKNIPQANQTCGFEISTGQTKNHWPWAIRTLPISKFTFKIKRLVLIKKYIYTGTLHSVTCMNCDLDVLFYSFLGIENGTSSFEGSDVRCGCTNNKLVL